MYRFDARFPDEQRVAEELLSEDFEHGRLYGSVRAVDPFLGST